MHPARTQTRSSTARFRVTVVLAAFSLLFSCVAARAQEGDEPGRSIGTVTTQGNLIVMTLNEGALGKARMFNLAHRTLRFTPEGSKYRVENVPWQWDSDFGPEMTSAHFALQTLRFPFSGKTWDSFSVGVTGTITFGETVAPGRGGPRRFDREGELRVDRYIELRNAASAIVNTIPAISIFFKPRMLGSRYAKELADRAVVTWSLTEPHGGIQDWTWYPTVNRFQAVLHKDGSIDFSYDQVAAQDAVIGVFPLVGSNVERHIATIAGPPNPGIASFVNLKQIDLSSAGDLFLKLMLQTQGPVPPPDDPRINGLTYRICISRQRPRQGCTADTDADVVWTVQGGPLWSDSGPSTSHFHYIAFGTGLVPKVETAADSFSVKGLLPAGFKAGEQVFVYATAERGGAPPSSAQQIPPHAVRLIGLRSSEVDLATVQRQDGPFPVVYEQFHYMRAPRDTDLACTVIKALGDHFDMLAYYSDFRVDNPEAGTPSDGPLGGGAPGVKVTGIGEEQHDLSDYCTQGRFQWGFVQPVDADANQMQEYPPEDVHDTSPMDITAYTHQLQERTFNGRIPPYDYAMSQIGHEMGHRWAAFVSAKVGGETIVLGPTHWARGLQAQDPFPYQRPVEASAMGGGVWQDNFDGTFTQLDDNYYVPATGWSYLDLYLMGMIAPTEVPDFFMLRNLVPAGKDAQGRVIVRADRTKITIADVIAAEGPRLPDVDHAQKHFNTGMVVVVEHGHTPTAGLLKNTEGIRLRWMDYWETTTGHRSTMTTNPK